MAHHFLRADEQKVNMRPPKEVLWGFFQSGFRKNWT